VTAGGIGYVGTGKRPAAASRHQGDPLPGLRTARVDDRDIAPEYHRFPSGSICDHATAVSTGDPPAIREPDTPAAIRKGGGMQSLHLHPARDGLTACARP